MVGLWHQKAREVLKQASDSHIKMAEVKGQLDGIGKVLLMLDLALEKKKEQEG